MHLDKYGLPVQADGDANDQLQRVGMIEVAMWLNEVISWDDDLGGITVQQLDENCVMALNYGLKSQPGVYKRHTRSDTDTVSADQLISVLAAHVLGKNTEQVWQMFISCIKRFGFAQNTRRLDGSRNFLPDFMLFRALPLFMRAHWILYPLANIADILLVALSLSAVGPVFKDDSIIPKRRGPDDVDDNNTVLTLAVCRSRYPTVLSALSCFIFAKLRPWNRGCAENYALNNVYHPVYGALRWYHRAEAGGNPEIAELWKPICKRYFE